MPVRQSPFATPPPSYRPPLLLTIERELAQVQLQLRQLTQRPVQQVAGLAPEEARAAGRYLHARTRGELATFKRVNLRDLRLVEGWKARMAGDDAA